MLHTRKLVVGLTALFTMSAACGSDKKSSTGPSGDTPTQAEFVSMMGALEAVGAWSFGGGLFGTGALAADGMIAGQTVSVPLDETNACPGGGTTRVSGNVSMTVSGTGYNYTGNLTQKYTNCKGTGSDGTVFTFNGSPTLNITMSSTETSYSITLKQGGSFSWAAGSRGGTCPINLTITATADASGTTSSGSVTGTMCGQSVNDSF